jgi:hypothetical protein
MTEIGHPGRAASRAPDRAKDASREGFDMTRRFVRVLLIVLGCSRAEKSDGTLVVVAEALTAQVTRVGIAITPAGIAADLVADPQAPTRFTGTVAAPVGLQTITAQAFDGPRLVGTGSAVATVQKGVAVAVQITILDDTGPVTGPDHSPVVTSLVTPVSLEVGDHPALSATAVDLDGDAMTYAWSASPGGCGTFATPGALSTTFTAGASGTCAVTFSATANGKSDSRSAEIQIGGATGSIDITVDYVPQPVISLIAFSQGATPIASVARTAADATLRVPFHQGTAYTVTISFDPWPSGSIALSDSCAGTIVQPVFVPGASSATATWTPTVASGACVVTATLGRETLGDTFFVVVLPVP